MPKSPGFRSDFSMSYVDAERRARAVRRTLEIGDSDPLPGLELFESLDRYRVNLVGVQTPVTYGVEQLAAGVEAEARFEEDELALLLSEESYRWLCDDRPRARFSLAHELGHVVLHAAQLKHLARMPHSDAAMLRARVPKHPPYFDTEWQSNAFAAALLMPASALRRLELKKNLSADSLIEMLIVSREAAINRIELYTARRSKLLAA
jgi:hypothetical protein